MRIRLEYTLVKPSCVLKRFFKSRLNGFHEDGFFPESVSA